MYKNGKKRMNRRQTKNALALTLWAVLTLLSATSLSAQEKWTELKFPIRGEAVMGMAFPSPDTAIVVTDKGHYARSFDGCKTWKAFSIRKDPPFEDVYFLNNDSGMICGRDGVIYRTVDGTKGWDGAITGDSVSWFTSCIMITGKIAIVAGIDFRTMKGVAYRTVDGSLNWTKLPDMGLGYGELFYEKGGPLCIQSYGRLHYSLDSGKTWSTLNTTNGKTGRATAFKGQTGVICGSAAMIAYSKDRGKTWKAVEISNDCNFTAVAMVDEKIGYICGTKATLLKTSDGGESWFPEIVMKDPVDFACMKLAGNYLYIGGVDGVIMRKKVR
jgi:photosystem II stability/assembly factor-like uncharacterized protein